MDWSGETICAISTAPGVGGIAVIRVSGPEAFAICGGLFRRAGAASGGVREVPSPGAPAADSSCGADGSCVADGAGGFRGRSFEPNRAYYGQIVCPIRSDGSECPDGSDTLHGSVEVLDDVMLTAFRAPHSFTGEDTVEISCHGSRFIQQQLIALLTGHGCRLARAGEFTQRAFLNGKMDLSQAEAVADLIAADSAAASALAYKQLKGGISNDLKLLRDELLHLVSLLELELDFSEEDVTFASREELRRLADLIEGKLARLTDSFHLGNAVKNGIPVAIVGETNAGKSTLLNLLLHEEKAIVSDIHGTTRDSIEDCMTLKGVRFRFIDTAGLRQTSDTIEQLGIERTYRKIDEAAIVLWVIDDTQIDIHIDRLAADLLPRCRGKKLLLVFNKLDRISPEEAQAIEGLFQHMLEKADNRLLRSDCSEEGVTDPCPNISFLHISAKTGANTDLLQDKLLELSGLPDSFSENDTIVTNLRHHEALRSALQAIRRVREGLRTDLSGDFISQDLREVIHHIGLITGAVTTDEVLGQIFSKFCIGK